jgi:pimeloyl-ACP methyl ester carboxylesterase
MPSERVLPAIDTRRVRSLDGAEIAYHVARRAPAGSASTGSASGSPGGPWIALANGLGSTHRAWRGQIDYLADRCPVVTWDYRGLYASGRPTPHADSTYGIDRHVADLWAVLDAEGAERAVLVGWSLGAQVVLEAYRRMPARVAGLVLVNGTYGRPFDTLSPLPGARRVIPPALGVLQRSRGVAGALVRYGIAHADLPRWAKRLGLFAEAPDAGVLREIAEPFAGLDLDPYLRIIKAAGAHDAEPVLSTIDVPVLIIAGDRDLFAPRELAFQMARRIPEAETLIVPGGTHFVPLEYPELVSLRIEKFVRDRGLA